VQYCGARNIAYRSTINAMKAKGLYLEAENKRMSKGMKVNTVPVQALIFDANHPDFSGITDLFNNAVTAAQPDADEVMKVAGVSYDINWRAFTKGASLFPVPRPQSCKEGNTSRATQTEAKSSVQERSGH